MPYRFVTADELNNEALAALKRQDPDAAPWSYSNRLETALAEHEEAGWSIHSVCWDDEGLVRSVLFVSTGE
jgi:hypothetical protein